MSGESQDILPIPCGIGRISTPVGGAFDWHTHSFDEFCLVDECATHIGHAGSKHSAKVGTLFLARQGERHGYWNEKGAATRLWVLHFHGDMRLYGSLPGLLNDDPMLRIWHLSAEQVEAFKGLFLKIYTERISDFPGSRVAQSTWLRLLLLMAYRWQQHMQTSVDAELPNAELADLSHRISDYQGEVSELVQHLKAEIPNYDSIRHRFKEATGHSPRKMLNRVRMDRAKLLLVESTLSIKEIARRTGYPRQHEFTRAFRRHFGLSPSAIRGR